QQITLGQIDLATDVTGTLPVGKGGTGTATAFTTGSIVFAGTSGVYTQDNAKFFWDDTNDYLGLGTNTPSYALHVAASKDAYLGYLNNSNTGSSAGGLYIRSDGTGNLLNLNYSGSDVFTVSGSQAAFNVPAQFNASGDVSIAYDINFSNQTSSYVKSLAPLYIEAGENYESNNLTLRTYNNGNIVIDNATNGTIATFKGTGNVGIGTTSPNQALEVNGRIRMNTWTADGTTAVYYNSSTGDIGIQSSDERLKKNITPINNALEIINGFSGYTFNWKNQDNTDPKTVGVIAQEVQQVMPELTYSFVGEDGQIYFGVHYDKIAPVLLQGIKEQGSIINTNKAQSDTQYNTLNSKYDQLAASTTTSAGSTGSIQLDFADLKNSLILDANTSVNMDANSADLDFDSGTLHISHNGFVGFNTTSPARRIDVADAVNPQIRITQLNNINYAELRVDGTGNLTINTTGTDIYFGNKNIKTQGNLTIAGYFRLDSGKIVNKNLQTIISFTDDGKIDQFADFTGDARRPRTINLVPEYPGSVKTSFYGLDTDTLNNGDLITDIEGSDGGFRNYYKWTSNQFDKNYKTLALRIELPSEFDSWDENDNEERYAISIDYKTTNDNINDNSFDVYIFNPEQSSNTEVYKIIDNASENISTVPNTVETEWSTMTIKLSDLVKTDTDTTPKWGGPSETGIIYIRMGASSSGAVQLGEIKLNYLSKW
ncbi:tail fiber domain-containing protein, partial [Candidatus Dojkabacteria bacterium]|nr:tail fiber domain-containing protein [Candidatus Dojkabacteria bacterium]